MQVMQFNKALKHLANMRGLALLDLHAALAERLRQRGQPPHRFRPALVRPCMRALLLGAFCRLQRAGGQECLLGMGHYPARARAPAHYTSVQRSTHACMCGSCFGAAACAFCACAGHNRLCALRVRALFKAGRSAPQVPWMVATALARHALLGQDWNAVARAAGRSLLTDDIHLSGAAAALMATLVADFLSSLKS